ncbi:unnamed protein product [Rotaria sp. Silwood1]|nr:unnamed protein product [Rotaria sp. Silwood1]CAF4918004.1 unnamed protein product [Rotaria sp. Silwood1]
MESNGTSLKMTPAWFKLNDQQAVLKDIVYPPAINDNQPFDTIAAYRTFTNKSKDFCRKPINIAEDSTETLILVLDAFARKFNGNLTITMNDVPVDDSSHCLACGIGNLGNVHMLTNNYVPMAKFAFNITVDYDKNFAESKDTMENFALSFCRDVSQLLSCEEHYIRILSVKKSNKQSDETKVHFGITKPNFNETQQLAHLLQDKAQKGFPKRPVLQYVKPASYVYKWASILSYFQLQPNDFTPEFNRDYEKSEILESEMRGGYPYYRPIGWYRHALKIDHKHLDDATWLSCDNADDEWPVAFQGTHQNTINNGSLQFDGIEMNEPRLYLATHCNGGSHPRFTEVFSVKVSNKNTENYRLVFQCRVQPKMFTVHESSIEKGEMWRFADPKAIRPYGLLLKKEEES